MTAATRRCGPRDSVGTQKYFRADLSSCESFSDFYRERCPHRTIYRFDFSRRIFPVSQGQRFFKNPLEECEGFPHFHYIPTKAIR